LRKFNRLTEVFALTAIAFLGIPDTAYGQSLTFSPNPVVLGIAGPGGSTTASVPVSSTSAITGPLQVTTINTTDRSNWLCATPSGQSLTVSVGSNCNTGASTTQLAGNQNYTGQINVTAPTASGNQSSQRHTASCERQPKPDRYPEFSDLWCSDRRHGAFADREHHQ
jgi:hypothetical protein